MQPDTRFKESEMLTLAGRALHKIDQGGRRGTERVTHDEIEAMAVSLVCLGMRPLAADEAYPEAGQ